MILKLILNILSYLISGSRSHRVLFIFTRASILGVSSTVLLTNFIQLFCKCINLLFCFNIIYVFHFLNTFIRTASTIERKILRCEYTFDANVWRTVSKRAKRFIASLLEGNVSKRLSAREANASTWIQSKSFALETSDKQNEFMAKVQDKILSNAEKREDSLFVQRIGKFHCVSFSCVNTIVP